MIRNASHYSIVMSKFINISELLAYFDDLNMINFHYDDEYADDGFVLVLHFGIMYIDH